MVQGPAVEPSEEPDNCSVGGASGGFSFFIDFLKLPTFESLFPPFGVNLMCGVWVCWQQSLCLQGTVKMLMEKMQLRKLFAMVTSLTISIRFFI
jgi:hypothetical protein